jgi:RNA-directed DNA polymerase
MLPDTVSRRLKALPEISKQGKRVNGLFRLMENLDVWQEAYANIYPNKGATTPGVGPVTLDGFSMERVANLIELLKADQYRPKPVRRVLIPKANGQTRPLGVPSGDDKHVQEVVRSLLDQIYEPVFPDYSHGFRRKRSCHTALKAIERWDGVKWLVEVDIQGFFDNIDHDIMIKLLEKKIDDKRFIALIKAMLKAGYMEGWKFHGTYSGTPQGGVLSPLLANIYLHELDKFVEEMKDKVDTGRTRAINPEYQLYTSRIHNRRKQIQRLLGTGKSHSASDVMRLKLEIRKLDIARKAIPSVVLNDTAYRRLHYCRYADDTLIGIVGSKDDAEHVMAQVKEFIHEHLNLEIAAEKSRISHAKEGTIFLGYEVLTVSSGKLVRARRRGRVTLCRAVNEMVRLRIPEEKLRKFCQKNGYGNYATLQTVHRPALGERSDAEIILAYNAECRGLANYYSLAYNASTRLHKLHYLWRGSLLKTLAFKHQTTIGKITRQLRQKGNLVLKYEAKGRQRYLKVFSLKDIPRNPSAQKITDLIPQTGIFTHSRTELIQRLNAEVCEYCGQRQGYFEVHHVRKLADIAEGTAHWQKVMASMQRKTMVLCIVCHDQLHTGTLPDWRWRQKLEAESRIH